MTESFILYNKELLQSMLSFYFLQTNSETLLTNITIDRYIFVHIVIGESDALWVALRAIIG